MSAYLIVNVDVQDPAAYEEYKAGVPAVVRKHGGEYLVRGDKGVHLDAEAAIIDAPGVAVDGIRIDDHPIHIENDRQSRR